MYNILLNLSWLSLASCLLFLAITFTPRSTTTTNTSSYIEYMSDFNANVFDNYGKIKRLIFAKKWQYNLDKNLSTVNQPKIILANGGNISANNGKIFHASKSFKTLKQIAFIDNVIINNNNYIISTNKLIFFPENNQAVTKEFARITYPNLTITGQQLTADLTLNTVEIAANVKTLYTIDDVNHI